MPPPSEGEHFKIVVSVLQGTVPVCTHAGSCATTSISCLPDSTTDIPNCIYPTAPAYKQPLIIIFHKVLY
jgi:hypothetical protein